MSSEADVVVQLVGPCEGLKWCEEHCRQDTAGIWVCASSVEGIGTIHPLPWVAFPAGRGVLCRKDLNNPPTPVGGIEPTHPPANPTHGSGWILQILSTETAPPRSRNPTHGSGWILQFLSTSHAPLAKIPPTAVGGLFSSSLHRTHPPANPTHGSGWILQILSTYSQR